MRKVSDLKGRGYLVSALSVVLLAIPACKSASDEPLMLAALLTGAALSIFGMALRWRSHRLDQKEKGSRQGRG
jgi:hypothetical protein